MTGNLQAQAMTRATQIAAQELKQLARDAGIRDRDFRISDLGKAIGDHIRNNPRILERAIAEVAAWKKGWRIRSPKTPEKSALVAVGFRPGKPGR